MDKSDPKFDISINIDPQLNNVLKTGRADAPFLMNHKAGTDTSSIFKSAYGFTLADFNKEADAYYLKLLASTK